MVSKSLYEPYKNNKYTDNTTKVSSLAGKIIENSDACFNIYRTQGTVVIIIFTKIKILHAAAKAREISLVSSKNKLSNVPRI